MVGAWLQPAVAEATATRLTPDANTKPLPACGIGGEVRAIRVALTTTTDGRGDTSGQFILGDRGS